MGNGTGSAGRVRLSELKEGRTFRAGGAAYIVLEHFWNGGTGVIRKEELREDMEFGRDNDWKASDVRRFLNGVYLEGLAEAFGAGNIAGHTVDLTSLDGLKDYGKSTDRVSLLDIDQYRRYREVLNGCLACFWWLVTPDSTPSGIGCSDMLHVAPDGDVGVDMCVGRMYVRPYFVLDSSVLISAAG